MKKEVVKVFLTTFLIEDKNEKSVIGIWQAICIQASTLTGGEKVYEVDDVHIDCCNDGVKPVIFKLEIIEEKGKLI